jgi:hypothetical protein
MTDASIERRVELRSMDGLRALTARLSPSDRSLRDTAVAAEVLDLSVGGVRLRASAALGVDTKVHISLRTPSGGARFTLGGTVRWVVSDGSKNFEVGISLDDFASEELLQWVSRIGSPK